MTVTVKVIATVIVLTVLVSKNSLNLKRVTRMTSKAVITKTSKVECKLSQKRLVSWQARFF